MPTFYDPINQDDVSIDNISANFYVIEISGKYYIKGVCCELNQLNFDPLTRELNYWPITAESLMTHADNSTLFPDQKLEQNAFLKQDIQRFFHIECDANHSLSFNRQVGQALFRHYAHNMDEQSSEESLNQNPFNPFNPLVEQGFFAGRPPSGSFERILAREQAIAGQNNSDVAKIRYYNIHLLGTPNNSAIRLLRALCYERLDKLDLAFEDYMDVLRATGDEEARLGVNRIEASLHSLNRLSSMP